MFEMKKVVLEMPDPVLPKAELRRRAVVYQSANPEIEDLAMKAATLLGYKPLLAVVAGGPLRQVLAKLEIEVLNPVEVKNYKAYVEREVGRKLGDRYDVSWKSTSLENYREPVPEFALRKAIQIKEILSSAQFSVEYLVANYKTMDPFLKVELRYEVPKKGGGTEWQIDEEYIEVWDEPEFEAQLLK